MSKIDTSKKLGESDTNEDVLQRGEDMIIYGLERATRREPDWRDGVIEELREFGTFVFHKCERNRNSVCVHGSTANTHFFIKLADWIEENQGDYHIATGWCEDHSISIIKLFSER